MNGDQASTNVGTIYDYIEAEEVAYTTPIAVIDGYEWNMKEHIRRSVLYKNSKFTKGKDDESRPFKNIVRPILNLQYRAEGFDVKDIVLFVNDNHEYYKSFLVKKYHEQWARQNDIDTFIDQIVESYCDFGGALVKDVNDIKPEVVPLQSIAFCDQSDLLGGPIGLKHFFSPDRLLEMADKGWGDANKGATITLEDLILLSRDEKTPDRENGRGVKTPGKYIEIYEVHGNLPDRYLDPEDDSGKYTSQLQIVAFYNTQEGKQGVTLFAGKEKKSPFKLILRDAIYGRALGLGGIEELFDPQVWVNYSQIRVKEMLDNASKALFQTTDEAFARRNRTREMDNGEILTLQDGKTIAPVDTRPANIPFFESFTAAWEAQAKEMGSATGALLGSLQGGQRMSAAAISMLTSQGQAIHDYRKGKLATFLGEIYRDWVIPHIATEITKGKEFLADLDLDEMQEVAKSVSDAAADKAAIEHMLSGNIVTPDMVDQFKQQATQQFMAHGNKRFLNILKDEMKDAPVDVEVSIANKQEDLQARSDQLTKLFAFIIANPMGFMQVMQMPGMAKSFNEFLEASGLSPVDFSGLKDMQQQQQIQQGQLQPGQPAQMPPSMPQLPQQGGKAPPSPMPTPSPLAIPNLVR